MRKLKHGDSCDSSCCLRIQNLSVKIGSDEILHDVNLHIHCGQMAALIGPNGAGKTTAFNAITGVYEPTNGAIYFNDKLIISNKPRGKMKKLYAGENKGVYKKVISKTPDVITKLGMARTFQNIRLFKSMTVFDNVLTAKHLRRKSNFFTATFHLNFKEEARMRKETMELLKLVELDNVKDELAISLPYG